MKLAKGYSLVELMVVVGIIGIIGAIAYPSYQNYISDTYRGQALADMRICALALDRFYSNSFSYNNGAAQCGTWSPSDGIQANRQYDLTVTITDGGQGYTVRGTPLAGCPCVELDDDGTISTVN